MSAIEDPEETSTSAESFRQTTIPLREKLNALSRTLNYKKRTGEILENYQDFKRNKPSSEHETHETVNAGQECSRTSRASNENDKSPKCSKFSWKTYHPTKRSPFHVPGWIRRQQEDCGTQTSLDGSMNEVDTNGTPSDEVTQLEETVKEKEEVCDELKLKLALCEARLATQLYRSDSVQNRLVQEFQCSVCQELLVQATVLAGCGHSFCAVCINEWTRRGHNTCPNCRQPQRLKVKCSILDAAVEAIMEHVSEDAKAERAELVTQRQQTLQQHHLEFENDLTSLEDGTETVGDTTRFLSDSEVWSDSGYEFNSVPLNVTRPSRRHWEDISYGETNNSGPIERLFESYISSSSSSSSSSSDSDSSSLSTLSNTTTTLNTSSSSSTSSSDTDYRHSINENLRIIRDTGRRVYRESSDTFSSSTTEHNDSHSTHNLTLSSNGSFNRTGDTSSILTGGQDDSINAVRNLSLNLTMSSTSSSDTFDRTGDTFSILAGGQDDSINPVRNSSLNLTMSSASSSDTFDRTGNTSNSSF